MRRLELGFRWVYFNPGKIGVNEMPELRLREGQGPRPRCPSIHNGEPSMPLAVVFQREGRVLLDQIQHAAFQRPGRAAFDGRLAALTSVWSVVGKTAAPPVLNPITSLGSLNTFRSIYRLSVTREDILGVCGDRVCDLPSDSKIRFIRPSSAIFRFTLKVLTPFDIQYSRSAAAWEGLGLDAAGFLVLQIQVPAVHILFRRSAIAPGSSGRTLVQVVDDEELLADGGDGLGPDLVDGLVHHFRVRGHAGQRRRSVINFRGTAGKRCGDQYGSIFNTSPTDGGALPFSGRR